MLPFDKDILNWKTVQMVKLCLFFSYKWILPSLSSLVEDVRSSFLTLFFLYNIPDSKDRDEYNRIVKKSLKKAAFSKEFSSIQDTLKMLREQQEISSDLWDKLTALLDIRYQDLQSSVNENPLTMILSHILHGKIIFHPLRRFRRCLFVSLCSDR